MNEARLPGTENLGHLSRLDVLVSVLWVIRPEQLGELLTRVLDEITDRPQACEQHQVPGIKLLPQLVCGHIEVDENSHRVPPSSEVVVSRRPRWPVAAMPTA